MPPADRRSVARTVVYEGRKVRLEVARFTEPDGREVTREIVQHSGSVAILAFRRGQGNQLEVLLERNYRHTVGRYVVEVPAGTLDRPEELPLDCARRELAEETGYQAGRLTPLLSILPSPGVLTERLTIFLAEELQPGRQALEAGEAVDVQWMAWPKALEMVRRGEIEDAKTIVALLFWQEFCAENQGP